jgi:HlyD family secretion protein
METATEMSATEVVTPPYAATLPKQRSHSRRWLIGAGGLLGVIIVAAALASRSSSTLERVLGRGGDQNSLYLVKPVDLSVTLTEDGELKPKNSVDVKCEVEGRATILWVVEESTRVKKGDRLVELADDEIEDRIRAKEIEFSRFRSSLEAATEDLEITKSENASKDKKAQIDLEVAQLELEKYLKGDFEKALNAVEIAIKQTQLDITRNEDELRKNQDLHKRGFVMKSKVEQLEIELEKAKMTRDQNQLSKRILLDYELTKNEKQKTSDVERAREELDRERKRAQSREKQAEAKLEEQRKLLAMCEDDLNRLKEQREKCKIFAPVDGIVQYPSNGRFWREENRISAGETVYEGQTLIVLPDTSQMVVETRIHEADRHKCEEGLECLVTVPAVPGKTFTGQVSKIARYADSANRWLNPELKEHTTEILLDETDADLSPGDSAEIKILIDSASSVLAVPVQSVFSRGSRSFVFGKQGGDFEPVEVELGRSSTTMVEVTNGLSTGDEVLMHAGEELLAMLPAPSSEQAELKEPPPRSPPHAKPEAAEGHQPRPKPDAAEGHQPRPKPEAGGGHRQAPPSGQAAGRPPPPPKQPAAKSDSGS